MYLFFSVVQFDVQPFQPPGFNNESEISSDRHGFRSLQYAWADQELPQHPQPLGI